MHSLESPFPHSLDPVRVLTWPLSVIFCRACTIFQVSEEYPHLIFDQFDTKLGERLKNILRFLFPVPKSDAKRVMTFANRNDFISFRHHTYAKTVTVGGTGSGGATNKKTRETVITEIGPRFEMRLYQLKLGTVDQVEADNEWVLRPYMNTAKKRKLL